MLRRLLIIAAVLAGLVVLADRGTSTLAASTVASSIQKSENLEEKPGVSFSGFPFLTQAFGGRYERIDLDVRNYARAQVRIRRIQVRLEGVHLSLNDALTGADTIPVDHGFARITVAYADVNTYLADRKNDVTVLGAAEGKLHVRGTVAVPGRGNVPVEGDATLKISGPNINCVVTTVRSVAGAALPSSVTALAASRLSFQLPVGALPFGIVLREIEIGANDLSIAATADHFVIRVPPGR